MRLQSALTALNHGTCQARSPAGIPHLTTGLTEEAVV